MSGSGNEDEAEVSGYIANADVVIRGCIRDNTRARYNEKMKHFTEYIRRHHNDRLEADTQELKLSDITAEEYKGFMAFIAIKKKNGPFTAAVEPKKYNSYKYVESYSNAIKDAFRAKSMTMSPECVTTLSLFFHGYNRKVADLKQSGEMAMDEGKSPMSFTGYQYIAEKAAKAEQSYMQGIFCWLFIVLCWNLMARSASVSSIMYDHIRWDGDSMTVTFPKHKGDQEGRDGIPKHVYANPNNPSICPILALAVFVFTVGHRREGSQRQLFTKSQNAESRFGEWIRKLMGDNMADFLAMGIMIVEIGTHSFRKGIASFLGAMTCGPTAIAIYIRAGWSLGLQKRYIMEGGGGDQLCGRAATGINVHGEEFAVLPPHFDLRNGSVLTLQQWEHILPGYTTFFPAEFRVVVSYLLASLVYHRTWLKENLHTDHPLFQQSVWTSGIMDKVAPLVNSGTLDNPETGMTATGVPPYVKLASELAGVKRSLDTMKEGLSTVADNTAKRVKEMMLEEFTVNGAVPISRSDVEAMFAELTSSVKSMVTDLTSTITQSSGNTTQVTIEPTVRRYSGGDLLNNGYRMWTWNGMFHVVPYHFKLPTSVTLHSMFSLWLLGNPAEQIGPYRNIRPADLLVVGEEDGIKKTKNMRSNLSKCKYVMEKFIDVSGKTTEELMKKDLPASEFNRAFTTAFDFYLSVLYSSQDPEDLDYRRIGDNSYLSMYEPIRGYHKNNP